jgi:hypothetical protein
MDQPTIRLHTKVGEHVFDGEGPPELVRELFQQWKELLGSRAADEKPPGNDPKGETPSGEITTERLGLIFTPDEANGLVTLRIPPTGENRSADATRLVLYGFRRLLGQEDVLVTRLKASLAQSGVAPERVDRAATPLVEAQEVIKTGAGKGGRYRITNTGIRVANETIRRLLQQVE